MNENVIEKNTTTGHTYMGFLMKICFASFFLEHVRRILLAGV